MRISNIKETVAINSELATNCVNWTSHATVDKLEPQIEARSNASGLTPPRWLWRRVRL